MRDQRAASPGAALARRKAPTQQRARNTVESIFQATEELVRAHGFENVDTRRIAERAGISIGSLYQYFPTYESILLAWYEEVSGQVGRKMKVATVSILHKDLNEALLFTLKLLLDAYEEHALVLIRMRDEVPAIKRATAATSFECLNRSTMHLFFGQHPEYRPKDTDRHIFFIENVIMSNLHRFVIERPAYVSRKTLLQQLCRIIASYLESCES
jgi:AcrR family transcriptional regulator